MPWLANHAIIIIIIMVIMVIIVIKNFILPYIYMGRACPALPGPPVENSDVLLSYNNNDIRYERGRGRGREGGSRPHTHTHAMYITLLFIFTF